MSDYTVGLGIGFLVGLAIGLPTGSEQQAIDAFNSSAVYVDTETSQLCLRESAAKEAPTKACIAYTP